MSIVRSMVAPRPQAGVVYTPREVCEPMVRVALGPLLGGEVPSLRVCDPAIGEGAFLIEVIRVLAESLAMPRQRAYRLVAERCVFGADVDARAVAAAHVAIEEFVGARLPILREHLRVGDALTLEWPRFDAIVCNPPYIRQELLANKAALRAFEAYDGVADLYVYFIELALRIARRYCFVVPNKWLTAAYGRPLRALLARTRSVLGLVDFARAFPLFADADAFPCILWGDTAHATDHIRAARVTTAVTVADALANPAHTLAVGTWHIDDPADAALIDRLSRTCPPLGEVVPERPSRGVVTGCNEAFVIDAETRARLIEDDPAAAALVRPFIKGRDVRRWRAAPIERYIVLADRGYVPPPRIRAHLAKFRSALEPRPIDHAGEWRGRKPGSYRWYELQDPVGPLAKSRGPRLFYQDIQTTPACCLDESGELVPDTTVWILPTSDLYLLAVLNSPLYAWYAQRRFPPALNGAVRPKLEYMRALPIAQPGRALRAKIVQLVRAQLRRPTAARDTEIGELVCEAYGLAAAERALI